MASGGGEPAFDEPGGLHKRAALTGTRYAMDLHRERARFDPDDCQELVDLAFGCPFCPGQAGVPRLASRAWRYQAEAHCRCTTCGGTWILELDLAQVRRLWTPADI